MVLPDLLGLLRNIIFLFELFDSSVLGNTLCLKPAPVVRNLTLDYLELFSLFFGFTAIIAASLPF